jgi:hypothetical protein
MFGQRALSQTVCKPRVRIIRFKSCEFGPPKKRTRNQGGFGWPERAAGVSERIGNGERGEAIAAVHCNCSLELIAT